MSKQPLINAGKIIERFGGIRPMAAKIDTPVTTVQGWKKRDVIPATRRTQIIDAAHSNNIDISDLMSGKVSNENSTPKAKTVSKPKVSTSSEKIKTPSSVPSVSSKTIESNNKPEKISEQKPSEFKSHDVLLSEIETQNSKAVATSAWVATGLILLAIIAGYFLLVPHFNKNKQMLAEQNQQLVQLEDKVQKVEVQSKEKFMGASIPDDLEEKIDGLQTQAKNISVTVDQLSEKAEAISLAALGDSAEAISERLVALENKIEELSGPEGSFAALVARIRDLEDSVAGQAQLESSADQLRSMLNNPANRQEESLNQDLAMVQNQDQGALGQTLEGVTGDNLKSAAILIAFSQFKSSLERQEPFEKDLRLLQNLLGNDDPALQQNLARLGPYAYEGVLTAEGLSKELKQMTDNIVASSLEGEDVSLAEKAKARLGNIVQIEKDGEMISGTDTQVTLAKAQDYIDQGKIEESIVTLETLDNEAAKVARPFIRKAKASLLAEKVKTMLSEKIVSKADEKETSFDVNNIKDKIEQNIPFIHGNKVVTDSNSGVSILPPSQPIFKGLTE